MLQGFTKSPSHQSEESKNGLTYGACHLVTTTFAQWKIWPVTDTWGVARYHWGQLISVLV